MVKCNPNKHDNRNRVAEMNGITLIIDKQRYKEGHSGKKKGFQDKAQKAAKL
jgi:hypothetical protein